MANKFLRVEYDKFSNKRETSMETITLLDELSFRCSINLRHVSTPEIEALLIDLHYNGHDWFDLNRGQLIININDIENIVLEPEDGFVKSPRIYTCIEVYCYEINKEILKKICDAKSVDFQISGGQGVKEVNCNRFIKYAQIFYNGFYDEEMYKEVVDCLDYDGIGILLEEQTESGNSGNGCMVTLLIMCSALSSVAACLIFLIHYL